MSSEQVEIQFPGQFFNDLVLAATQCDQLVGALLNVEPEKVAHTYDDMDLSVEQGGHIRVKGVQRRITSAQLAEIANQTFCQGDARKIIRVIARQPRQAPNGQTIHTFGIELG